MDDHPLAYYKVAVEVAAIIAIQGLGLLFISHSRVCSY